MISNIMVLHINAVKKSTLQISSDSSRIIVSYSTEKTTDGETLRAHVVGLVHFPHITITHSIIREEIFSARSPSALPHHLLERSCGICHVGTSIPLL